MRIIALTSMMAYSAFLSIYVLSLHEALNAHKESLRLSDYRLNKLSVIISSME